MKLLNNTKFQIAILLALICVGSVATVYHFFVDGNRFMGNLAGLCGGICGARSIFLFAEVFRGTGGNRGFKSA